MTGRGVSPMAEPDAFGETGTVSVSMVIVDDDPEFRRLAAELFAAHGVDVLAVAEDGAGGIAAVGEHQPDWVLLDVNLPDTDGVAVSRALQRQKSGASILLASTGQGLWSDEELAEAGVQRYVDKDRLFDADVLQLVLGGQASR